MNPVEVNEVSLLTATLVCPIDRKPLEAHEEFLLNPRLGVKYRIVNGIPDLTIPDDRANESSKRQRRKV